MSFYISICIHIIGFSLWMGGLFILLRGLKFNPRPTKFLLEIRNKYVGPGLVLTIASAMYQLMFHGMKYYMTQGWFHGKLTAVVLLLIATVLVWREITRGTKSDAPAPKWFAPVAHSLTGLGFLAAIVFVILGRVALI